MTLGILFKNKFKHGLQKCLSATLSHYRKKEDLWNIWIGIFSLVAIFGAAVFLEYINALWVVPAAFVAILLVPVIISAAKNSGALLEIIFYLVLLAGYIALAFSYPIVMLIITIILFANK